MRRWGLILLVVVVVLGGGLGWALLNINRYLNDNRDWIATRAESATGRRISFGEVGLSIWGGFGAAVSDLQVADDPAFSKEPFVTASTVRVKVALWPALLGRIEVQEVVLEAPLVRLIRDQAGMNFDSIGAALASDDTAAKPDSAGDAAAGPDSGGTLALIVALFTIRDGQVEFIDRTVKPATTTAARRIDLSVTGLGTADPASIDFAAALFGNEDQNLGLSGTVGPIVLAQSGEPAPMAVDLTLRIGPADLAFGGDVNLGPPLALNLQITADAAPLDGWNEVLPALSAYELSGSAAVNLAVEGEMAGAALPAVTGNVGLTDVAAKINGSSDEIEGLSAKLEFLGAPTKCRGNVQIERGQVANAPFEALFADVSLADDVASLDTLEISLFDGTYAGKGRYDFRDDRNPRFDFRQELRGLDVALILTSQAPEAAGRMTGRLSGSLEVGGAGGNESAIHKSLRGQGAVSVADGVLVGVNLPDEILKSLTGISGLTTLVSDDLRGKYVEIFAADDTVFEKLSASVVIADENVTTNDAVVAARDYTLRGDGSLRFDGELDFTTTFVASEPLTNDVIKSVREARYITNDDGRLEVPARIKGVLPDVRVEPDADFVARALTKGALGKGLELLGGGKKDTSADPAADGDAEEGESKRPEDVGAELIEKGLRGLFGD